jgi:flagellar biogenesis protein FliO
MRFLQGMESAMAIRVKAHETEGIIGWLLGLLQSWRGGVDAQTRQMQLIETLPLGGKRQLMLVSCGGEQFLVGGGLESIETIMRVKAGDLSAHEVKNLDLLCQ